jgi:hypothetical protein
MSEQPNGPEIKPKRTYTRKPKEEPKEVPPPTPSEVKSEPPPKKKRVLSEKQIEALAKGREARLAKLKSVNTVSSE